MSMALLIAGISAQEEILTVDIQPASIEAFSENCPITSGPATAIVSGGIPGYTYAWSQVSGNPITITSPASPTTTFSKTEIGISTGVFRCTVTDLSGDFVSQDMSVELECGSLF